MYYTLFLLGTVLFFLSLIRFTIFHTLTSRTFRIRPLSLSNLILMLKKAVPFLIVIRLDPGSVSSYIPPRDATLQRLHLLRGPNPIIFFPTPPSFAEFESPAIETFF